MAGGAAPVALVTGGAVRLGAVLAEALHSRGWNLVVHCNRSVRQAEQLAGRLNAVRADSAAVCAADLTQDAQVLRLAQQAQDAWGRLDGLVNNAALYYPTQVAEACAQKVSADVAAMRNVMEVNALAPLLLSRCLAGELRVREGWILNMLDGVPQRRGFSAYDMSKAALQSLTRSLAGELAPVRVNALMPLRPLPPVQQDAGEWQNPREWPAELHRLVRLALSLAEGRLSGRLMTDEAEQPAARQTKPPQRKPPPRMRPKERRESRQMKPAAKEPK